MSEPAGSSHTEHRQGFIRRYIFSLDHKVIAKQYLILGLIGLLVAGLFAVMIRTHLADPNSDFPLVGKWLFEPRTVTVKNADGSVKMVTVKNEDGSVKLDEQGNEVQEEAQKEIYTMNGKIYNVLFTNHGMIMVFFAITPIVIGAFGNFVIPLHVGARDMAFPTLNMVSFWTIFTGALLLVASFFVGLGFEGAAGGGWTLYPTLTSTSDYLAGGGETVAKVVQNDKGVLTGVKAFLGDGPTLFLLAIALAGTSSLMGGINYIATIFNLRTKGMTMMRLPLVTWGLLYTSILNVLWVPVIATALFLLILDRQAGTSFFVPRAGGQPLLFQHLFWGFGHPEVYILILPVWGLVGDLLSVFSRKPAFGYKATVISMGSIVVLSQIVWGHHMFTSGMSPMVGHWFVFLTISISIPTAIFFVNWLGTLWRGSIRLTVPMLFSLGVVFVFTIGGLTGLFNALLALDIDVHDTYFVVGHFHYTLAASVLLGGFAGIHYWFPKMFGRKMSHRLGVAHFALSFVLLNAVFFSMMYVGAVYQNQRRISDWTGYSFLKGTGVWNEFMGHAALGLGLVQLIFVVNFLYSLVWGPKAERNPWQATSLEWVAGTPPPHGNFETLPEVYRGPHEFSSPEATERDWIVQDEKVGTSD